jgi:predicted nucleotidyltransferase
MMTRDEAITEITRRLVEYYCPERVYLFGSVARGEDGPDSDLDFLVVVPDDIPAEKLRGGAERRQAPLRCFCTAPAKAKRV